MEPHQEWNRYQNVTYILSLDPTFAPFLVTGTTWSKKTRAEALRGFTNDPASTANTRTTVQKVAQLKLMLVQIASFCHVISRNTITKNPTSIDNIWKSIRAHYGFQSSGAHFLDLINIKLKRGQQPEDLYQRLMTFVENSLMFIPSGLTHIGVVPTDDEELTPALENLVVLLWFHLINKGIPGLVKQRYDTYLRSRTLASIKSEISQAIGTLLATIQTNKDTKIMRAGAYPPKSVFKQST